MASKKLENPARLAKFLDKEAAALANHWVELTKDVFKGYAHPDCGTYKVRFPKSPWTLFKNEGIEPADHPNHTPFATLVDPEGGPLTSFLAVDASDDSVCVWDGINGEGFFRVANSLGDFKALLRKKREA